MRTPIMAILLSTVLAAAGADAATTPYNAEWFAAYRPQTALDMVAHTPGVTLRNGNGRRGLAGAFGNLLIDGRRPIVKDQTLEDVLKTIPAAQVLRIEVLTGDAVAGDPSGEAALINVIRVNSSGSGYTALGAELANRGRPAPNGQLSWTGRSGVNDYSLGLETYGLDRDQRGVYSDTTPDGDLTGTSRERSPRRYYETKLNGQISRPVAGGQLSLTAQGLYSRYHEDTVRRNFAPDGVFAGAQATPYTETTASYSASADYRRRLGLWTLDVTAFGGGKHFFSGVSSILSDPGDAALSIFHQDLDRHSAETLVRTVATRDFGNGRVEAGGEIARNTMDATLGLTFTAGGQSFPIDVPDSNSHIVEDRSEVHIGYTRDLTRHLGLDLRLTREASELRFRGDSNQVAHYAFLKPSLTLTRRFGGGDQVVLRVYRDADQIDFNDFVSAVSLKDSVLNGGNPGLRPQTSWRTELSADHHFGPRAALTVKLYHYALSDTADLLPIRKAGVVYAAPGNIGRGSIDGVTADLTMPLDRVLPGASLTLAVMRQTSRVIDPVNGLPRPLSNLAGYSNTISFRQNLSKRDLAWGFDYKNADWQTKYLLAETDATRASPALGLWMERSGVGPCTLRLTLESVGNQAGLRRRIFYLPDRAAAPDHVEAASLSPGRWLTFTVSRGF